MDGVVGFSVAEYENFHNKFTTVKRSSATNTIEFFHQHNWIFNIKAKIREHNINFI
jgi:hypothetical protein